MYVNVPAKNISLHHLVINTSDAVYDREDIVTIT
jgi:hypothetical protein